MKTKFNISIKVGDYEEFKFGGFVENTIGEDLHNAVQLFMKDYYKSK